MICFQGPGHVESKNRGLEDGIYRVFYRPESPGDYTVKIRYADQEVIGSPFKVRIV